jgi:hypothetical protein
MGLRQIHPWPFVHRQERYHRLTIINLYIKISQIKRVKISEDVCMPFVERTGAAVTTLYLTIFLRGGSATRSKKEKKQFVL